jgi:hypothetical protein
MMSWLTLGSDVNSLHEGIPRHRDRALARIRSVPSRNTYGMGELNETDPHICPPAPAVLALRPLPISRGEGDLNAYLIATPNN